MERRAWRTGQGLRAGVGWCAPGWGGGGERRRARPSLPRSPPPRGGGNGCGTRPHAGRWRARARQWARQRARAAERQPPARPTASPGGEAPVERGGGGEGGGYEWRGCRRPAGGRHPPPQTARATAIAKRPTVVITARHVPRGREGEDSPAACARARVRLRPPLPPLARVGRRRPDRPACAAAAGRHHAGPGRIHNWKHLALCSPVLTRRVSNGHRSCVCPCSWTGAGDVWPTPS